MAYDYKLIGERIKKVRQKKGLTQEKLAESLNVSIAYLSRIENGATRLNLKRLNQICNVLDVSEAYLLNGSSEESKTYLNDELNAILRDCTPDKKELIYQIAAIISEKDNKNGKKK